MPTSNPEYHRLYYQRNRERILAQQREYRQSHPEKRRATKRAWREAHMPRKRRKRIAEGTREARQRQYNARYYARHHNDRLAYGDEYREHRRTIDPMQPLSDRPLKGHGTTACYRRGCRCDACRAAQSEYMHELYQRKRNAP